MNTSPTFGLIAAALAAAQLEMQNPTKDRTANVESDKAKYSYNYADLASVLDVVRPCLARQGIALVQTPEVGAAIVVTLGDKTWRSAPLVMTTRLMHSSGEWIESQLASDIDPDGRIQTLGSAISYLRRYALQALVGVMAEEDDDGNVAQGTQAHTARREGHGSANGHAAAPARRAAPPQQPAPAAAPAAVPPKPLTPKQRYEIACDSINERLGSKAGHDHIMAIRNKHGGESATDDQKLKAIAELEASITSLAPAAAAT